MCVSVEWCKRGEGYAMHHMYVCTYPSSLSLTQPPAMRTVVLVFVCVTMSVNSWKSSSSCGVRARGGTGAFVGDVDVGDVDGGSGADDAKCQELL